MMAVKLGFEQGLISEIVDYSCTKLGGKPVWPPSKDVIFDSRCLLCNLYRPLVLQCYAPLENSAYHRILYVFACINPVCWNKNESWTCVRSQLYDESYDRTINKTDEENTIKKSDWCSGADNWEDDDNFGNGSSFGNDTKPSSTPLESQNISKMSDDDDDDEMTAPRLDELEHRLQNMEFCESAQACAEIEGEESKVVLETPMMPENNIAELLHRLPELPDVFKNDEQIIEFLPKYVYVSDEYLPTTTNNQTDYHVKQLLQNYEKEHKNDVKILERTKKVTAMLTNVDNSEEYERDAPRHGNELFHNFLTRIQHNPGQIIRYSIGDQPLVMSFLPADIGSKKCKSCGGFLQFEFQLLSTMIPSLKIAASSDTHLEFGTALIYTCKSSCWKNTDKVIEECCIVQAEP